MKTVKVRIAVAVDAQGNWASVGWSGKGDYLRDVAREGVNEDGTLYWVEAEVPIPSVQVIQGEVFENE